MTDRFGRKWPVVIQIGRNPVLPIARNHLSVITRFGRIPAAMWREDMFMGREKAAGKKLKGITL